VNPHLPLQKRRDRLVIMADILQIARNGVLKTQILYRANLSFEQLTHYLDLLTSTGLLKKTSQKGKEVFEATTKGLEFLKTHQEIMGLLSHDSARGIRIKIPPGSLFATTRKEVN